MHNSNWNVNNLYNKLDRLFDSSGLFMHACQTKSIPIAIMIITLRNMWRRKNESKMSEKKAKVSFINNVSRTAHQFCWNTSHTHRLWHLLTLTAINIYRFNRCMSHSIGHLPLLPTPSVPMTATLVSPNEDFFRRR